MRYLPWFLFILLTLGAVDVKVSYSDGAELEYTGWITRILNRRYNNGTAQE